MKSHKIFLLIAVMLSLASVAAADTQRVTVTQPLQPMPAGDAILNSHLNKITAEIDDAEGAKVVMSRVLTDSNGNPIDPKTFDDKKFYCMIHVLRWSPPAAGTNTQTIQAQNWYLYNKRTLTVASTKTTPRLFGAKRVTLLYIHLNKQSPYEALYRIEIVKKTPAYLSHLLGLANLYNSVTGGPALAAVGDLWAAYSFDVQYKVSDITVTPKLTRDTGAVEDAGVAQNFDNEGKYFVDFSVGVPVRKFSQLEFSSTNNLVTAKEVDQTDVLALVNLYPRPIDIRSNSANLVPHFVGGVAIAKKPLDRIFVGAGFGPVVANFYIGAIFAKQQQLSTLTPGDAATTVQLNNDLRRRYKAKVAFGLNVPVGAIIEKLKK